MSFDRPAYYSSYRKRPYVLEKRKQREDASRSILNTLRNITPCMDCGLIDGDVMQFDHREGETKLGVVTAMIGAPHRMAREILKCDIVCANCHVRRTRDRGQYVG